MLRSTSRMFACAALLALAGFSAARAAEPTVVLEDLENPSGVAIHPKTGHFFIAERKGVVRLWEDKDGKWGHAFEIDKYPSDIYGKGPMYDIGPLGLAFMDDDHLIVGDGSRPDASELVRVYKIGAKPPAKPAAEDSAVHTLGPIGPGMESAKGEGNFYAIAVTNGAMYITSNGDDTKGWIVRSVIENGKPGPLKGYIATKPLLNVDAPVAITTNKAGELVVSQMGEVNVAGDSLLTTYDPKTGSLTAKYKTGLDDIAGLAYSPVTGKLYGVDFGWVDPKKGALYEFEIKGDACTPKKVADLDKPTSLAFDKDGNLYVAVFGTAAEGAKTKPGKLLKFAKSSL
jgi:DNA-binding beta-propeller fold protein YncE